VADRDDVRERDLACLVDDQRVEEAVKSCASEEPRRARDELELLVEQVPPLVARVDELPSKRVSSPEDFLRPAEREALPLASRSIPERRFAIALWLSDVTPTRGPRA
jgi:hypothetical protein